MLNRSSLSTVAVLALAASASAQAVGLYTFAQTSGTYTPVTGGTVLATATPSNILDIGQAGTVALPFSFPWNGGQPQTDVRVNYDGSIVFGTTAGASTTPISTTTVAPGYIAAYAGDLQGGFLFSGTRTSGSNQITAVSSIGPMQVGDAITGTGIPANTTITAIAGNVLTLSANATASGAIGLAAYGPWADVRWEVVGTSPNQEFVVQWSNFRRWTTATLTTAQDMRLNFQVRLREDGQVQCVYGDCSPGATTSTTRAQVGLRGSTNTDFNSRQNVKGTNDDWSLSTASTLNSQGMLFNNVAPANVIPNGLTYTWTPDPNALVATNTTLGTGCGGTFGSWYQYWADSALASPALTGNSLQLTPNGAGYNGTWLPGTAASLFVTPVAPTTLATGDDGSVTYALTSPFPTPQGPQNSLLVTGNAVVTWGGASTTFPGTSSWVPTPAAFLAGSLGGVYAWHDYNQAEAGSGPIQAEEIGNVVYLTWNGVESYQDPTEGPNPSTLQFQLDKTTGNITIAFVSIDNIPTATTGSGHLVGYTPPGASADPGSVNLATATLSSVLPELANLALAASNRPIQGAGPNNWNLTVSNIPPSVTIGADILGLADPGLLDISLFGLGKPGCQLRANLDVVGAWLSAGPTHNWALPIPGGAPALNGFVIYAQSATVDLANFANNTTTNGVQAKIGNL